MKILVIGGTGSIGSKVVSQLRALDHDVIAGSPKNGINSYTGEGLEEAMKGTDVVIDVANSSEFDEKSAVDFFDHTGRNLATAARVAGVRHQVAISIVGCDRIPDFGYMKAKVRQEEILKNSGIPYTIVRSTQFFEFVPFITMAATKDNEIFAPATDFQPIAVEEAAAFIVYFAVGKPINGTVDIAGPERKPQSDFIEKYANVTEPGKTVIQTGKFEYTGIAVPKDGIVPAGDAYLGKTYFDDWLDSQQAQS
ncbi:MAG: NAD(P)H-binding protein [Pedobacter sp.]|jgi:uncharacterized protein YbjT (DUF2867 family)|uniref:SDR family oxidoreductase n=1 Tax=Pedobacter sp. TaxID=1411316 RepID=UPI003394E3FC